MMDALQNIMALAYLVDHLMTSQDGIWTTILKLNPAEQMALCYLLARGVEELARLRRRK